MGVGGVLMVFFGLGGVWVVYLGGGCGVVFCFGRGGGMLGGGLVGSCFRERGMGVGKTRNVCFCLWGQLRGGIEFLLRVGIEWGELFRG